METGTLSPNTFPAQRLLAAATLALLGAAAQAEIEPERITAETLPKPGPHWVWVSDISFNNMIDGKSFLLDADSGKMLGMISGGNFHDSLGLPGHQKEFYSTDTFYSRGSRGDRVDVVSIYDARTLDVTGEIIIPPKQLLSVPTGVATTAMSEDDRFLYVYNFTPAQSLSIVNLAERKFVGEVETAGCAMTYPVGPRKLHMICADASFLTMKFDDAGAVVSRSRSKPMFDPKQDLVNDDAVRAGNKWYFVSYKGDVYTVDSSGDEPVFEPKWSLLTTEADRAGAWRPGGYQLFSIHEASGRMYVIMHPDGKPSTHKDAGTEVWVFDLASKKRIQRIDLRATATIVKVSPDAKPLLYTASIERPELDIYDALSGAHLRTVTELGQSPTVIQVP